MFNFLATSQTIEQQVAVEAEALDDFVDFLKSCRRLHALCYLFTVMALKPNTNPNPNTNY